MFKWLRKKKVKQPEIGEIWRLSPDDPWDTNNKIEILDLKDGWVRYRYTNTGAAFQDERMIMRSFLYCFGLAKKEN